MIQGYFALRYCLWGFTALQHGFWIFQDLDHVYCLLFLAISYVTNSCFCHFFEILMECQSWLSNWNISDKYYCVQNLQWEIFLVALKEILKGNSSVFEDDAW